MKSSLVKLKRFALNKSDDGKDSKDHRRTLMHMHGLPQASQDMKDIRNYYDSLLSAAAASANSAYEFSESLLEMGNCLLEKTAFGDDGDCGKALSLLGRVQLELRRLVDIYRAHIILTITKPSESLLNELRKVEEMKLQCDEKREVYEYLLTQHREKGRLRGGKGDSVTSKQLQVACEDYDEAARLCAFRVESLKQGQCRSLFTQAARHHAAQLNFFRRGLESLETVEPHIKIVAEKQRIDYQLSGLGNVENEDGEEITSYESNDERELSFDYGLNKQEIDNAGVSRNSVEADVPGMRTSGMEDSVTFTGRNQREQVFTWQSRASSHSAPIYAEKFDSVQKIKDAQTTVRKFHTHVLPTPADAKKWTSRTSNSLLQSSSTNIDGVNNNLWHSSPIETEKQRKSTDDNFLTRNIPKSQFVSKDSNINNPPVPLPPPFAEGVPVPKSDMHNEFDYKNLRRLAFSGPLPSKTPSGKPSLNSGGPFASSELQNSGLLSRIPISQLSSSINVSLTASPPPVSSPRISELHELPRPPGPIALKPVGSSVIGHSAPQGTRKREVSPTNRSALLVPNTGAALPPPPLSVPRSFSIPSSSQRAMAVHMAKLLESPRIKNRDEAAAASPPLTPISLSNLNLEVAPVAGHIKVDAGGR